MITNVKNGTIILGDISTNTATIRIGDIDPSQFDFEYNTKSDGFYIVLGDTNEKGIVERIWIAVNSHNCNLLENDEVIIIDPDDVIAGTIDGK